MVFVFDDDVSVRESLELLIRSAGLQPKTFASAEEFLTRLCGDSPANELAVTLLKRQAVRGHQPTVDGGGLPRHRLKRVLDYIGENLCGDLSLSQLAAIAGMSPHYFAELFRRSTGCAPHQYVLRRRINFAKDRLRDTKRSVIDVGLEAGFENPSHFSRVFRKLVGISPSDFRSKRWISPIESLPDSADPAVPVLQTGVTPHSRPHMPRVGGVREGPVQTQRK
jgi:AraC-like DNA-binding protein